TGRPGRRARPDPLPGIAFSAPVTSLGSMPSVAPTPTSRLRSDAVRPSAQPASSPPAGAPAGDPDAPAPRLDGRRVHIVDRALDYVALAATGLSAAKIARKRRRSAGYVSILLRLGRAIQGLEPAEPAARRSPRV